MPQQCHKHLCSRINPQTLLAKCQGRAVAQKTDRSQFTQLWFGDGKRQAAIATWQGMADTVVLDSVEKQDLVRLSYGLIVPHMPDVDSTIGKHQLRGGCALSATLLPAAALTVRVPDCDGGRFQQRMNDKFRNAFIFGC